MKRVAGPEGRLSSLEGWWGGKVGWVGQEAAIVPVSQHTLSSFLLTAEFSTPTVVGLKS